MSGVLDAGVGFIPTGGRSSYSSALRHDYGEGPVDDFGLPGPNIGGTDSSDSTRSVEERSRALIRAWSVANFWYTPAADAVFGYELSKRPSWRMTALSEWFGSFIWMFDGGVGRAGHPAGLLGLN